MEKKINVSKFIPLRNLCGNDGNYKMLVEENFANRDRLTEIVIQDMRNGGVVSDAQINAREAHLHTQSLVDALYNEKKILENIGLQQTKLQAEKAKKERPKKNEHGESLDGCITKLARSHPGEKPSKIWPHLATEIREWSGGEVRETGNKIEGNQKYHFIVDGTEKTISFGTVRKKLGKMKIGI